MALVSQVRKVCRPFWPLTTASRSSGFWRDCFWFTEGGLITGNQSQHICIGKGSLGAKSGIDTEGEELALEQKALILQLMKFNVVNTIAFCSKKLFYLFLDVAI